MIFLRTFVYIIVFFLTLIYFFPMQKAITFTVDKYAKQHSIDVKTDIYNSYLIHKSKNTIVIHENKKIMDIEDLEIRFFIFMNELVLKNIKLNEVVSGFFPAKIDSILAKYTLINPSEILLEGNGDFGTMTGYINGNKLYIKIIPSALMIKQFSFTLGYMKKVDESYVYEYAL